MSLAYGNDTTLDLCTMQSVRVCVSGGPGIFNSGYLSLSFCQYSANEREKCVTQLAQLVEHETLNLSVVGLCPMLGANLLAYKRVPK